MQNSNPITDLTMNLWPGVPTVLLFCTQPLELLHKAPQYLFRGNMVHKWKYDKNKVNPRTPRLFPSPQTPSGVGGNRTPIPLFLYEWSSFSSLSVPSATRSSLSISCSVSRAISLPTEDCRTEWLAMCLPCPWSFLFWLFLMHWIKRFYPEMHGLFLCIGK